MSKTAESSKQVIDVTDIYDSKGRTIVTQDVQKVLAGDLLSGDEKLVWMEDKETGEVSVEIVDGQ